MAAGMGDYKIQVDKLERPEDWAKWKWHVSMLLRSCMLEDVVNGTQKCPKSVENETAEQKTARQQWLKDDAKAASLLAGALGKSVAELVLTCTHANEIWEKLHARFERSSTQRLNMLIEAFFRVQRDDREDISAHVAKLQKLFVDLNDELQKHNESVLSERILNGRILSTLGKEYDNFKDLWDTIFFFPYEMWYDRPVRDLSHLKIFGTECYVHVNKQFRSKFDDKAIRGYLVGYVNNGDGFRVWIPSQKKIVLSHDVKFKPEVTCNLNNNIGELKVVCDEPIEQSLSDSIFNIKNEPENKSYEMRTEITTEDKDSETAHSFGGSQVSSENEKEEEEVPTEKDNEKQKREKKKPKWMTSGTYVYMAQPIMKDKDPCSYSEALMSSNKDRWLKAIHEELESLKQNDTWVLVERPSNVHILQNRWVLREKVADDGKVRFKGRLVAKGYVQRKGIDYGETFSPVARYDTIRTLLAVAAAEKMKLDQFDVKTAFLNGLLKEIVYMEQPEGFEDGTERVCLLKKSLYGLKQAPRCWNERFVNFMTKAGFKNSDADPCLFYRKRMKCLYVAIYVDDGLVVGSDRSEIEEFMEVLKMEFHTTRGSLNNFLGMKIQQMKNGSIAVSQEDYVRKILERFGMAESNGVSTPIGSEEDLNTKNKITTNTPYREAVGCLLYLTTASRPDIAFAVNKAARSIEDPTTQDWNRVKRIFRYLKNTMDYGIVYKNKGSLKVYSDADYAGDRDTRRSTTGIIAILANGPVSWTTQLQKSVATSTMEAEIISASEGAKELIWLKRLLSELIETTNQDKPPTLYIDNASTVKLSKNPEYHRKSKHIEVRHFYVRERFLSGDIGLEHINGTNQLADLLTKPLERVRFEMLRERIGVQKVDPV